MKIIIPIIVFLLNSICYANAIPKEAYDNFRPNLFYDITRSASIIVFAISILLYIVRAYYYKRYKTSGDEKYKNRHATFKKISIITLITSFVILFSYPVYTWILGILYGGNN
ncbi:MAG: hypothetical protein IKI57_04310 [Clostridia bacterium]|nr:hypothetical protein [Clostridia bacterium]